MTLDVNKEELTILGIPFDNFSDFDTTVQDVIDLKTYVINKRKELNIG